MSNTSKIRTRLWCLYWKWCYIYLSFAGFSLSLLLWYLPKRANPIRHMRRDSPKFFCPLDMWHLVIKEDVWLDFLQNGPFRFPSQEAELIDLKAPAPQSLQDTGPWAGSTAGCYQVGTYGAGNTLILSIELLLKFPKCLQETLQWTLSTQDRYNPSNQHTKNTWM